MWIEVQSEVRKIPEERAHHSVVMSEIYPHFKKKSWNQFKVKLFSKKKVILTKFLQNNVHMSQEIKKFHEINSCVGNYVKLQISRKNLWKHCRIINLHLLRSICDFTIRGQATDSQGGERFWKFQRGGLFFWKFFGGG